MVNDNAGRIITITFTLNKQNFHITTLYGPNKPPRYKLFLITTSSLPPSPYLEE